MGARNRVFSHAVVGGIPQDLKYRGEPTETVIGDDNTFREFVTINAGTAQDKAVTRIGNGCLFMAGCHVGHDCVVGDGAIIANSVALAGHVILEDHVHFGGLSAAHQFSRVGRLAFIGGMTGVAMDVAPYCMISGSRGELTGLNVIGLQRSGMDEDQVGRVKQAYKIYFRSSLAGGRGAGPAQGGAGAVPRGGALHHLHRGHQARHHALTLRPMATIGLIAGSGGFPALFAAGARRAGHRVVAAAHVNQTDPELERHVDALTWVKLGQFGKIVEALKAGGATQTVLLGAITKKRFFVDALPDAVGLELMAKVAIRSDDNLLRDDRRPCWRSAACR